MCEDNLMATIEYLKSKIEIIEKENTILKEMIHLTENIFEYIEGESD